MSETYAYIVEIPSTAKRKNVDLELARCLRYSFPNCQVRRAPEWECELCGTPWSGAGPVCDECGGTIINTHVGQQIAGAWGNGDTA